MISIRTRLLIALLALVAAISLLAGTLTYRRVLAETSTLFDYQLRQMALVAAHPGVRWRRASSCRRIKSTRIS